MALFHYGTHYSTSTSAFVVSYLLGLEPFTTVFLAQLLSSPPLNSIFLLDKDQNTIRLKQTVSRFLSFEVLSLT
jgi:hypothetical protein